MKGFLCLIFVKPYIHLNSIFNAIMPKNKVYGNINFVFNLVGFSFHAENDLNFPGVDHIKIVYFHLYLK